MFLSSLKLPNPYEWSLSSSESPLYLQASFLPVFMALGLLLSDVQRTQARFKRAETLLRIIFGSRMGLLAFTLIHALIHFQVVGRYIIAISWSLGVIMIFISRFILWKLAKMDTRAVIFWGTEHTLKRCEHALTTANLPIKIIEHYLQGTTEISDELSALYERCQSHRVEALILAQPEALSIDEKRELTALISKGIRVRTLNDFFERELERVHVEGVDESWLWDHEPTSTSPYYLNLKRAIDITLSLIGLLALAPIFPLIALMIWLQDRGPIFYSQERLGLYGVPFQIYKFRTMRVNAEEGGAQWAQQRDQRITKLGQILRKSRLDETPQFFNILRGDMSFVGPRPEREELVRHIEDELPNFRFRHLAKPGLSGWAQINYGYGSNIDEARIKLSYDLYYLKHASLQLDLLIVLRTFSAMMRGAR